MINIVQQGVNNNYKPAFGDRLVFASGKRAAFVDNFGKLVNNSHLKKYGVARFYKLPDGYFDANKFMKRVQNLFKDETLGSKQTYVVEEVGVLNPTKDVFLKIRKKGSKSEKDVMMVNAKTLLKRAEVASSRNEKSKPTFCDLSQPDITILTDTMRIR